jgi:large subunit ribosomal protein L10
VNKVEKHERVDSLRQELAGITSVIVAEYRGLTMTEMQNLRKALRKVDGQVRVVKNTLARLSVKGTSLEAVTDKLVGPVLITYGPEPVGPAKATVKAAQDMPKIVITGGCLAGRALSPDEVKALSLLPSQDELRAKFLGVLNAVPSKFVGTLAGVSRGLLNVLTARKEQLEGPAVEAEAA